MNGPLGRASSVAVTIDATYTTSTTFDAAGRVDTISSPHGYSESWPHSFEQLTGVR